MAVITVNLPPNETDTTLPDRCQQIMSWRWVTGICRSAVIQRGTSTCPNTPVGWKHGRALCEAHLRSYGDE